MKSWYIHKIARILFDKLPWELNKEEKIEVLDFYMDHY